jgi:hypothetical protein
MTIISNKDRQLSRSQDREAILQTLQEETEECYVMVSKLIFFLLNYFAQTLYRVTL